jgi:hypothetical protein
MRVLKDFVKARNAILNSDEQVIVGSIFNNALIHYVRASKSDSDHRKTFFLDRRWSEQLKAKHHIITNLRDDVVAHFGPGKDGHEVYADDRFVHAEDENGVSLLTPSTRANYREKYINFLNELIAKALVDSEELFSRKAETASKGLADLASNDDYLARVMAETRFSPEDYYFSSEDAKSFVETFQNRDHPQSELQVSRQYPAAP